jgi:hypothetical protein
MKLSKQLAKPFLWLVLLSGCSHYQTSDWQASITLPASGDCWSINVMSRKEERIPADDPTCIRKKARAIWLDADNYKLLRRDIQTNCQFAQCKQITGAFDSLFLSIDAALQKIPTP